MTTPRTPEDARLDPQVGDTKTWTGREVSSFVRHVVVLTRNDDYVQVRGTHFNGSTWTEDLLVDGRWNAGESWAWAVGVAPGVRTPEDARLRPQAGDTLTVGSGAATRTYTVAQVRPNGKWPDGAGAGVEFTDGLVWSLDTWSYRAGRGGDGRTWAPAAPAARCPRTDPQPGDTTTGTTAQGTSVTHVVKSRDGDVLVTYEPQNPESTRNMPLSMWQQAATLYHTWTWTRGDETPAPEVAETPAPSAAKAWYETRGLPACLAALPTPTDGQLEALDLWAALEALGYLPTGADDSGRVTIAPADEHVTVYRRADGRYAVHWNGGLAHPPGGLAAAMAAYTRARTPDEAPAAPRDVRTDPQVGDTKTWTFGRHDGDYIREILVTARAGDKVTTQGTRYNGATYTCDDTVAGWASGGGWTFAVGADAPAGAPV